MINRRCVLALALGSLLTACGQHEKGPPRREPPRDASAPRPTVDAAQKIRLGRYETIKTRFEADCPRDLPEGKIGEVPSLYVSDGNRNCRRPFVEQGRKDVVRYLEVIHPPAHVTYDYIDQEISRVTIGYFGAKGTREPASCGLAVDEVVAYLRDLTGASEEQGRRVSALIRQRIDGIPRIHLMDRELCVWEGGSGGGHDCYANVASCYLAEPAVLVDVDLAAVELPAPSAPTP